VVFYGAMLLLGSVMRWAGTSAIYLLAAWFPTNWHGIIGLYLMIGAFGATVGPPVSSHRVGQRQLAHALAVMGWAAVVVGLSGLAFVRDIRWPAAQRCRCWRRYSFGAAASRGRIMEQPPTHLPRRSSCSWPPR